MVRILKWLAAGVVALAMFVLAVYALSRAMGPTRAESAALALVDAPPQLPDGRDGFAALYSVGHDVPASDQARVLAEDVRRFAASPPLSMEEGATAPGWRSVLDDWPRLDPPQAGVPPWCPLREPGCIERVRAAPEAYAGLIERHAVQLERSSALAGYDYFRNPFAARLDMPIPAYQSLTHLPTRNAWRFARGELDAALAGTCDGVALGRRMIESGDSLIASMIGAALVQGHATLLAEMLAELPRQHPLPAQCSEAVARPLALEQGVCRVMLGEGRFSIGGMRTQVTGQIAAEASGHDVPAWGTRLLFDPERTAARMAPTFAWYCGDQARALVAADRPLADQTPPPSLWSLRCASNPVGCILADIAQPAYADYGVRLQDAGARLRTTAALLWLRGLDGPIDEAALARAPAPLRSPERPLRLDLATGTLGTALYEKPRSGTHGHDGTWSVPLPGSRLQSAGVSP
ncbi:hypothetical protein [Pseudoxanthomonas sp. Soil82]|uniref:hypothetical protein n=1 Tax=Pseudoxanthomonas sp. Soil82 TaxID=3157341 RepID=UPI00338E8F45